MQGWVLLIYGVAPLALALLILGLVWQRGRRGVVVLTTVAILAFAGATAAITRAIEARGMDALAWVIIGMIAVVGTLTSALSAVALHRAQKRHRQPPPNGDDRPIIDLRDDR